MIALLAFSAPELAAAETPLERQWELASRPAAKVAVREKGWYRVGPSQLRSVGIGPGTEVRSLRLYTGGQEVPLVVRKSSRGRLGGRGVVEFYGRSRDTDYTDTRWYWLVSAESGGRRVPTIRTPRPRGAVTTSFVFTAANEPHERYHSFNNGPADNFFGPQIRPGTSASLSLEAPQVHPEGMQPILRVRLQGFSTARHQVKVAFNGNEVGTVSFAGQESHSAAFLLPREALREGTNSVTMSALGGELDFTFLDRVAITYTRRLEAAGGAQEFSLAARRRAVVSGFATPRILLVDITRPAEPKIVTGRVRRQEGGGYALAVSPSRGPRRLLAVADSAFKRPAAVVRDRPSTWHSGNQGADLVIISHRDFLSALEPLRALREAQGFRVATIDVADLYDEFSFGAREAAALRSFLERSETWQPRPRYVLLFGDSTIDPRDFLKSGKTDFVPTKVIETPGLETISDDWFVDFDEDSIPELAIGRLPVDSLAEARTVVAKVVGYDLRPPRERPGALMLGDVLDGFGTRWDSVVDDWLALVPPSLPASALYGSRLTSLYVDYRKFLAELGVFRVELFARMNEGPTVVAFVGHGAEEVLGSLFASRHVPELSNADRLSFFAAASCLNASFAGTEGESLAEVLMAAPNGGAIGMFASSGFETANAAITLNKEVLRALFGDLSISLGEAIRRAKIASPDEIARKVTLLIGDPTTRLHYR